MKLSQSNFNLRSPDCYLVRSYLIATVCIAKHFHEYEIGQQINMPFKIETYQTFNFFSLSIKTFDFAFVVVTMHESFQPLSETYYLIKNKYKLLNLADPVQPEQ